MLKIRLIFFLLATCTLLSTLSLAQGSSPAVMISPAPGSTLSGSSATFTWSTGTGVIKYMLIIGTTSGAHDVAQVDTGTATSLTVNNLPTGGANLYVELLSDINYSWVYQYYTYTQAGTSAPAVLTSPTPGSKLSGSSVTFTWNTGSGVTEYYMKIGTTYGAQDVYPATTFPVATTSTTVSSIPTGGANLYVELYSLINSTWQEQDFIYTQAGTSAPAVITNPTPGSTLSGSTVTFNWTAGSGVTEYLLLVGTSFEAEDVFHSTYNTPTTSATVSNVPAGGATLYVTLYSLINSAWVEQDFTFNEYGVSSPAALTSPAPGSILSGTSATFNWTTGSGVTKYLLYLGSTYGADNLYNSGPITSTSATVSNLPAGGVTLYAELLSMINGAWQSQFYTYTEAGTPAPATMTSPAAGSTLGGSSANFSWAAGNGVTQYLFYVGTSYGSDNVYNSGPITSTSAAVTNIPTAGATLYVELLSQINGAWQSEFYTYTETAVSTTSTALSSSLASSTFGTVVKFTATISPAAATGTVTLRDGSLPLGTVPLSSGSAAYSISTLSIRSHAITAIYSGDANFSPSSSAAITQVVSDQSYACGP